MKKISFTFIKNKLFLAGFISVVPISALAFIFLISSEFQPQDKNKLKGTLAESYKPAVGDKGKAQSWGLDCGNKLGSCEVLFDKDRAHNYVHCHYQGSATRVEVVSVTPGDFCAGGGVTVKAAISQY